MKGGGENRSDVACALQHLDSRLHSKAWKLSTFDVEVDYWPGTQHGNGNADGPSHPLIHGSELWSQCVRRLQTYVHSG